MTLEEMLGDIGHLGTDPEEEEPIGYYPYAINLIWTQPARSINEERTLEYMYQIEAGARPVIITTAVDTGVCEFILDGHHKLVAYGQLGLPIHKLCITALDASRLTLADYPRHEVRRSYFDALTWEEQNR